MAKANESSLYGTARKPKFDGYSGTYLAYGKRWVKSVPIPADDGVDNATWLGFLYKQGIIYGYGEVPLNSLDWFAQQAKGALVGIQIDGNQAISDFQASPRTPWSSATTGQDGHDTLLILTNTDGSGG